MAEGVTVVLGIAVMVGAAYLYHWYRSTPSLPPLSGKIRHLVIGIDGKNRTYLAYVPSSLPPQAALVIVLHGSMMNGARMRECCSYEFDSLADRHGFVVLYPDGYRGNWNDCRKDATFPAKRENIDDVGFIQALIDKAKSEQSIDETRVYVFGYSNGGHMAFRLAIEAADKIAAIAAVGASLPVPDASSCPQEGRTSRLMLINGTLDPISPYSGGVVTLFGFASRGAVMSSLGTAQSFAVRNGISTPPTLREVLISSEDTTSVETMIWHRGDDPFCCLCTVHGGGHVIPQRGYRFPRLLGRTTSLIDAPSEAIRFFERDE
jgi:polyhydroxybutyrate depolymerase